jgi:hypothetical protein
LTSGAEIVQNSHFNTVDASNYPTVWSIFAQPTNPTDLVGKMVNGAFEYYRTPSSTSGVLVQHTGADFAQGQGMLAQFFLSNTSDVRKRVSVLITEGDFSDITVCTFWLPPNLGVRRFGMLTHTTKPWTDATISFYAASAGSNGGAYRIDDVTLLPTPWSVEDTLCVDPFKPPIGFAPDGPNMIINGDFSAPWTPGQPPQNWNTPNQIVWQVAGGVFEFLRPVPNADPAGVVLQQTGQPLSQGDILTADFQLGNSSGVRKRVTVLLQDADFSDLSACTFWLAPGQPLSPYRMRSYASKPWANATISIFAATAGNEQWMRLDNVTMKKTPSAHINGADCDEPPVGPEPPTEGAAAASVTGAARSSVTASAESAASGVELGANGSGASTVAIRSIDLRQASGSLLRFQSRRGADVSRAEIQISLDGETWQTLADVPPSDDWLNIDIDLSGFAGQVVQLRFVIDGEVTEDRSAFNRWVMRHFEIWW